MLRWSDVRRQIEAAVDDSGRPRSNIWMLAGTMRNFFGRPGLTWPRRTSGLSLRVLPAGSAFADKGPALFRANDSRPALLADLAIASSRSFSACVDAQLARTTLAQSFELGILRSTPVPKIDSAESDQLAELARRGWSIRRSLDMCTETSHAFVLPALLHVDGDTFAALLDAWSSRVAKLQGELEEVQFAIDERCFELYGVSAGDRRTLAEGYRIGTGEDAEDGDDTADSSSNPIGVDPHDLAARLVSWAVGVGVGRFDVRLATGGREWSAEPDPFDPLPVCSPAMLTGEDGLPVGEPPVGYPVSVSPVLVDDRGHELDIIGRVRAVFDVVFGADADSWWADTGEALGARRGEISSWLRKGFFDHHLKSHSKSRRKAPILWPIGTASGSHVVWLYAHRVTADSLFQVLNDIVDPKLRAEQRHLTELTQEAGPDPSAGQREALDAHETLVGELRELRDELEAVTPLWAPDLNDGIVIVLAPLWRLFAHRRPWSQELKKHWDKLTAGDYDWAQLAMHLWPERVIPKCAKDRSLAIAHGLEDVFWIQDPNNTDKWHPRPTPTTPIDQLITERHKPATKAALQQATP